MFTAFRDVLGGGQRVYDKVWGLHQSLGRGVL
jgi:hypothetical protein